MTQKQYSISPSDCQRLEALAGIGFPLEHCGAKLTPPIPKKAFLEIFWENDKAQLAYESGEAEYAYKLLQRLEEQSKDGKESATSQLIKMSTLKPSAPSKSELKKSSAEQAEDSTKVKELAPHLFDLFIENSYEDLTKLLPKEEKKPYTGKPRGNPAWIKKD